MQLTFEVSYSYMRAIMFTSRGVIPFNPEPGTAGSLDFSNILDSAEATIIGQPLPQIKFLNHGLTPVGYCVLGNAVLVRFLDRPFRKAYRLFRPL